MNTSKILSQILRDLSIDNYHNMIYSQRASGGASLQIAKPGGKYYLLTYDNSGQPLSIGAYNMNDIFDEAEQNEIAIKLKPLEEVFQRDRAAMSKADKQAFFTKIFGEDCMAFGEN